MQNMKAMGLMDSDKKFFNGFPVDLWNGVWFDPTGMLKADFVEDPFRMLHTKI